MPVTPPPGSLTTNHLATQQSHLPMLKVHGIFMVFTPLLGDENHWWQDDRTPQEDSNWGVQFFQKFAALSSSGICGLTHSENAQHLLVWAYHEWCVRLYVRQAYKIFFPKLASQNTAFSCFYYYAVVWFSSSVSSNSRNAWHNDPPFANQIQQKQRRKRWKRTSLHFMMTMMMIEWFLLNQ